MNTYFKTCYDDFQLRDSLGYLMERRWNFEVLYIADTDMSIIKYFGQTELL